MTFSPELEQRIEKMLNSLPARARQRSALIPMLLYCQDEVGHITEELIQEMREAARASRGCRSMKSSATTRCSTRSRCGKYHVQVCTNISCLLRGGEELMEHAEEEARPRAQRSRGRTACSRSKKWNAWAPAHGRRRFRSNYDFHHNVTPEMLDRFIDDIAKVHRKVQ